MVLITTAGHSFRVRIGASVRRGPLVTGVRQWRRRGKHADSLSFPGQGEGVARIPAAQGSSTRRVLRTASPSDEGAPEGRGS